MKLAIIGGPVQFFRSGVLLSDTTVSSTMDTEHENTTENNRCWEVTNDIAFPANTESTENTLTLEDDDP